MLQTNPIVVAPVVRQPFPFFIAEGVLDANVLAELREDFPPIKGPGSFLASEFSHGPAFEQLLEDIKRPELRELMEDKFGVSLKGKPLFITVRAHCQLKDGRIHTDSEDKIVTCLLYLNDTWNDTGGRLRLLRSATDLADKIIEIPPNGGTFLAFKRTDNSWHGHEKFEGQRRCVQINWLTSKAALGKNVFRHKLSATFKGLKAPGTY